MIRTVNAARDCAPGPRVSQRAGRRHALTLAPCIPIAIESGLLSLVPGNSAIAAQAIKGAGIKMEAN
jgi:hypothetical protein